jgi:hypothetical protein
MGEVLFWLFMVMVVCEGQRDGLLKSLQDNVQQYEVNKGKLDTLTFDRLVNSFSNYLNERSQFGDTCVTFTTDSYGLFSRLASESEIPLWIYPINDVQKAIQGFPDIWNPLNPDLTITSNGKNSYSVCWG